MATLLITLWACFIFKDIKVSSGGVMLVSWWVWMNCWIWSNHTACTLLSRHAPHTILADARRYSHTGIGERHTRHYSFEIWNTLYILNVDICISMYFISINLNIIIIFFLLFTTESSSIHFDAIIEFTEFPAWRLMCTCKNDPWSDIHWSALKFHHYSRTRSQCRPPLLRRHRHRQECHHCTRLWYCFQTPLSQTSFSHHF